MARALFTCSQPIYSEIEVGLMNHSMTRPTNKAYLPITMQAVRCLKFLNQCPPKAAALFKCFWTRQNVAQSPQHASLGQLYLCTRGILTDRDGATGTQLSPDDDLLDGSEGRESEGQAGIEDTSVEYFTSLVSSPSGSPVNTKQSVLEKRLQAKSSNLKELKPIIPTRSGNLATYVNQSETLTRLVQLGVDLSLVEKHQEAANHLLKVDFETGVQPYLEFLLHNGVSEDDLGHLLTKNPKLLMEDLDDLEIRIKYLKSKKFDDVAIARILTKAPLFLSCATKDVDTKLGFLQKLFILKGSEVRQVITAYPKLTTWQKGLLEDVHFVMKEFLGFTDGEQKQMLLFQPKIYTSARKGLEATFDYLHNTMGLSHTDICLWPQVFRTRLFIIKQRHKFLQSIDRAQYDPKKENFVSLKALVSGRDAAFCEKVAKVPVSQYNTYLKSL